MPPAGTDRATVAVPRSRATGRAVPSWSLSAQPRFPGAHDRLRATSHLQLVEYGGDVVLHRLGAEVQPLGDFGVAPSCCECVKNLALAIAQLREHHVGTRGPTAEETRDPRGDGWPEQRLTRGDSAHRTQELGALASLEDVAARAGPQCGENGVVIFVHREHEHGRAGVVAHYPPGGLQAGE